MSNGCDNSGVMLCAKIWSEWKPSFCISGHWQNNMIVYSSHVCSIYSRYLQIYPENIWLEYIEDDTENAQISSNIEWQLEQKQ